MPKMRYFCLKIVKIAERWGFRPQTPLLPPAGALLPDPQPPAAGGFASRPSLASEGCPQTPATAPSWQIPGYVPDLICVILSGALSITQKSSYLLYYVKVCNMLARLNA